jgi:hypothetical protein
LQEQVCPMGQEGQYQSVMFVKWQTCILQTYFTSPERIEYFVEELLSSLPQYLAKHSQYPPQ